MDGERQLQGLLVQRDQELVQRELGDGEVDISELNASLVGRHGVKGGLAQKTAQENLTILMVQMHHDGHREMDGVGSPTMLTVS